MNLQVEMIKQFHVQLVSTSSNVNWYLDDSFCVLCEVWHSLYGQNSKTSIFLYILNKEMYKRNEWEDTCVLVCVDFSQAEQTLDIEI